MRRGDDEIERDDRTLSVANGPESRPLGSFDFSMAGTKRRGRAKAPATSIDRPQSPFDPLRASRVRDRVREARRATGRVGRHQDTTACEESGATERGSAVRHDAERDAPRRVEIGRSRWRSDSFVAAR